MNWVLVLHLCFREIFIILIKENILDENEEFSEKGNDKILDNEVEYKNNFIYNEKITKDYTVSGLFDRLLKSK